MAKFAEKLMVNLESGRIEIDGEEFPFLVSKESIHIDSDPDTKVSVAYIPIFVKSVTIERYEVPDLEYRHG